MMRRKATSRGGDQQGGRRRGSVYILVLSVSMLLMITGLAAYASNRIQRRTAFTESAWEEAGWLAVSAVEHALARLNDDADWRTTYDHEEVQPKIALGNGSFTWMLVDTRDHDLDDDFADPLRIHGIGEVGEAVRVYSVLAIPTGPLDALKTAVHADNNLEIDQDMTAMRGPLSSNTSMTINPGATVTADVETPSINQPGNVIGTVTAPAPTKPMPSDSLWETYEDLSTEIRTEDLPNSTELRRTLVSPTRNPADADKLNADGVYRIKVPALTTFRIEECRILGTLLVELSDQAKLEIRDSVVWEPFRSDYPALIVYTNKDAGTAVTIDGSGDLDEANAGVNFNPPDTPYSGVADTDIADTYGSVMRGLFHVIRDVSTPTTRTEIERTDAVLGCLIADGKVRVKSTYRHIADPKLFIHPPLGYTSGAEIRAVPNSWRWEAAPD